MTDNAPAAAPSPPPDWRAFAAEIRKSLLAKQADTSAAGFYELGETLDRRSGAETKAPSSDRAKAMEGPASLTHRQNLLILALAATLGSRATLEAALSKNALIVLGNVDAAFTHEVTMLLKAALPAGLTLCDDPMGRYRPGAVILVNGAHHVRGESRLLDLLAKDLAAALAYTAPVILLLPPAIAPEEVIGTAAATVLMMRGFDREIVAALLAGAYPGSDAAAVREQLPSDMELAQMPMLRLMLALRCDDVETATAHLREPLAAARSAAEGKSPGKPPSRVSREDGGIRLAELVGLGEAQHIASGIVADLRAWQANELPWRDVHRGLLIAGQPGCGKTELARAMAREPGIHLEAGSYGAWQANGHLGDMLRAMRESFERAVAQAPAILFIDEIDAFGSRISRRSSSNQAYEEKVIAGLLEELDGVEGREGVVVIGACNHPDRIDPAIRRAGRFDDLVYIPLPDLTALATILRQHLGGDLPDADLATLAELALGRTGADCAAAVRSARAAARREARALTEVDLRRALAPHLTDMPQEMRRRAAIHEAGHAVVMTALDLAVVKALRLGSDGAETLARWHRTDLTAVEIHRHCIGHLSGRAAERLVLGEISGGAGGEPRSDLAKATQLVIAGELAFGLGDHGHLSVDDMPERRMILDLPAPIRARLQRKLDRALDDATAILRQHRTLLESLARDLETQGIIGEAELAERLAGVSTPEQKNEKRSSAVPPPASYPSKLPERGAEA
ncbi:AAA family ATPase [Paracoccus sp. TK19116]|uniref:AAA family ATPase n=1 Tax=Paracoccus albicereus TaxID=2922394 RepID=A0ABT1MUI5_9RHOB|nr:AAA family ATPase [Paracoccus albicereus]MCQ0971997.1 AAA family ATPase [Paracoccus albicereus]